MRTNRTSNSLHPNKTGREKWSRYVQTSAVLPEQHIVHALVDVYFHEADWYFTVLDRYSFDRAYRDWLLHGPYGTTSAKSGFVADDIFFPALLYQLLAMAIQFLPEYSPALSSMRQCGLAPNDHLSQSYSDAGESILDLLGRHHHSIVAVQADLLRCAWLKNSGQGSRAWYSLGSAIRYDRIRNPCLMLMQ